MTKPLYYGGIKSIGGERAKALVAYRRALCDVMGINMSLW